MNAHPTLGGFFDSLADSLAQNDSYFGSLRHSNCKRRLTA